MFLQNAFWVSLRRACQTLRLARSTWFYRAHGRDQTMISMRMKEIAYTRIRYGYRRIQAVLRCEGFKDNYKRIYRIYCEQGLNLRIKRPRRSRMGTQRLERIEVHKVNQIWSMDFVADQLFNGNRFRILTIVDNFSKKSPGFFPEKQIKGADVVAYLNDVIQLEGSAPERIQVDNGSEFISKELDRWAYENKVVLDFSRPGKPTDNPYIESFNGKLRDECLSTNWFLDMDDARRKIEAWRKEYNELGPHSSLSDLDVPPFIRPLLLGKNSFAEPEILPVSAFLKNCAGELNCNPPAIAR